MSKEESPKGEGAKAQIDARLKVVTLMFGER